MKFFYPYLNLISRVRSPSPEYDPETEDLTDIFDENGELKEIKHLPLPQHSTEAAPQNRVPSPILREKEELDLIYVSNHIF